MPAALTRLELALGFGERNTSLRFGKPVRAHRLDRHRCAVYFEPGAIFAHLVWQSNGITTAIRRLTISQALSPLTDAPKVIQLSARQHVLLSADDAAKAARVLRVIEAIEREAIEPSDVDPDYWRLLNQRLARCGALRIYTPEAHAEYLKRKGTP